MPKTIVETTENIIYEPFNQKVPQHIKDFCADRKIVTQKVVDGLEDAAKIVLAELKGNSDI